MHHILTCVSWILVFIWSFALFIVCAKFFICGFYCTFTVQVCHILRLPTCPRIAFPCLFGESESLWGWISFLFLSRYMRHSCSYCLIVYVDLSRNVLFVLRRKYLKLTINFSQQVKDFGSPCPVSTVAKESDTIIAFCPSQLIFLPLSEYWNVFVSLECSEFQIKDSR